MKNDGKYLEMIASEIENALVDNPLTKIIRNHNIVDRDGFEREIDIFIETAVNNKILKYAIECKDYKGKSRVQMKHIDEFYQKISNQGIKGIFLTTGFFQKNAIEKATKLNIDLYKIEQTKNQNYSGYKFIYYDWTVKHIRLISRYFDQSNSEIFEVYKGVSKQCLKYKTFFEDYLMKKISNYLNQNKSAVFNRFLIDKKKIGVLRRITHEINLPVSEFFFKDKTKYYPIESFYGVIEITAKLIEDDNPVTKVYKDYLEEKVFASFYTNDFVDDFGETIHVNIVRTNNQEKVYIESNNKKKTDIVFRAQLDDNDEIQFLE